MPLAVPLPYLPAPSFTTATARHPFSPERGRHHLAQSTSLSSICFHHLARNSQPLFLAGKRVVGPSNVAIGVAPTLSFHLLDDDALSACCLVVLRCLLLLPREVLGRDLHFDKHKLIQNFLGFIDQTLAWTFIRFILGKLTFSSFCSFFPSPFQPHNPPTWHWILSQSFSFCRFLFHSQASHLTGWLLRSRLSETPMKFRNGPSFLFLMGHSQAPHLTDWLLRSKHSETLKFRNGPPFLFHLGHPPSNGSQT